MRAAAASLQHRFAVEGDAEAGSLDHRQIVGAVADGERIFGDRAASARAVRASVSSLASRPRTGSATSPVSRPVGIGQQRVGALLVEADRGGEL